MHLGLGDGSRLEALFHAVFYLTGVPILFSDYNGNSNHSVGIIGGSTIDNNTSLETGKTTLVRFTLGYISKNII